MTTIAKKIPNGELQFWTEVRGMDDDTLVRLVSAFQSFDALINAEGYRPSLWLNKGQHRLNAAKRELAFRYDATMIGKGDPRRAYRGDGFVNNL